MKKTAAFLKTFQPEHGACWAQRARPLSAQEPRGNVLTVSFTGRQAQGASLAGGQPQGRWTDGTCLEGKVGVFLLLSDL